MAVEKLKNCDNIVALSEELGVHRRLLYKWRDQLDPAEIAEESPPQNSREATLRKEVNQLKRLLAEKTVEVDFFKGALQKIEARRQRRGNSGETRLHPGGSNQRNFSFHADQAARAPHTEINCRLSHGERKFLAEKRQA
jgi:transposase-like protein